MIAVFHGWGANSNSNWYPWLKAELLKKNLEAFIPDLPNSRKPLLQEWIKTALEITDYDENTILVGHSLGTVLIMRLLEKFRIRAAFLVAGFDQDLGIIELKNFFASPFDYNTIKKNAKIYMLSSDNDSHIPLYMAGRMSKKLNAKLLVYKKKGHLNLGTGNFEFPELRDMILYEASN